MSQNFSYPRLLRSEAIKKIDIITKLSHDEINSHVETLDLNEYHYSAILGSKISKEKLLNFRVEMIEHLKDLGFPNKPSAESLKAFDSKLTIYLYENLNIIPNEASKNEVWNFLTCELLPDVVKWRFFSDNKEHTKEAYIDRYMGGRRNTLQRLWWRGFTLKNLNSDKPYYFLDHLFSDDMRELEERSSLYGNQKLVSSIVSNFIEVKQFKKKSKVLPRDILRDVIKRVLRQLPWLSFESLDETEINKHIRDLFTLSFQSFDEEITQPIFSSNADNNLSNEIEVFSISNQYQSKLKVLDLVSKKFRKEFIPKNPNFLTIQSEDKKISIALYISKRYPRTNQKYWYSVTTKHLNFLENNKNSYLVFGMEDKDYCFILSHKWFLDRKDLFNRSLTNYGSKTHIYIEDETGENYIVRSKDDDYPLESIQEFIFPSEEQINIDSQNTITEKELIDPAIKIIKDYGNNGISTSDLIKELRIILKPTGEDTKQLKGRADDKFSQKVRNLKSHRKLEKQYENISFINDKYYWVSGISKDLQNKISEIPKSIDWRSDHYISVIKEKLPITGGQKAMNQWEILKNFDKKTILEFTDEASKQTFLKSNKFHFHGDHDGLPWWEQELLFCLKKNIIKITNENGEKITLN